MDKLSEIVFCEPTAIGQIGASLLHLIVWAYITDYERGVMAYVHRWIKRQAWYPTVQENFKEDDAQQIYDFPDPGFNYATFFATCVHHGAGGLLMSLGMILGQPWLWRHGMLVEVGGMDLLDAVRIAHAKLCPPGTFPTRLFLKAKLFAPLMFFHHSVGLCVGIPVNMYFSDVHEFQMFGLMTLGFPAVCLTPSLFFKTLDGQQYPRLLFASKVYLLLTFGLGSRTLYHFPAAWHCFKEVLHSPVASWSVLVPFVWALLAMSLFNIMILSIQLQGAYHDAKMLLQGGISELPKRSTSVSVSDLVATISLDVGLTNLYVASRMVAWAGNAKDNVKKLNKKQR